MVQHMFGLKSLYLQVMTGLVLFSLVYLVWLGLVWFWPMGGLDCLPYIAAHV
jgi:hypothetical protein